MNEELTASSAEPLIQYFNQLIPLIDALADTMVLQISYDRLIALYEEFPKFHWFYNLKYLNNFIMPLVTVKTNPISEE